MLIYFRQKNVDAVYTMLNVNRGDRRWSHEVQIKLFMLKVNDLSSAELRI